MKPKYAIGMLLQYTTDRNSDQEFGKVDAVITRADSFGYIVNGFTVNESDVTAAWVRVATRTTKNVAKTKRTKARKGIGETTTAETAQEMPF